MRAKTKQTHSRRAYIDKMRYDPRSTEELITQALTAPDEESIWEPVEVLWYRSSSELLKTASSLLDNSEPKARRLGALIIGQGILIPGRVQPDQSLALLLPLLSQEQDTDVLSTLGWALGQIQDARAIRPLVTLKNHPNSDVRYGVVQGLLWQTDEQAVATLIELSEDEDTMVRNWATFGIARLDEVDNSAVRDALWARVMDVDDETRGEALLGLAQRGDERVIDPLLRELAQAEVEVGQLVFDAAVAAGKRMADAQLYPALLRLQTFSSSDVDREELREAIVRSAPPSV